MCYDISAKEAVMCTICTTENCHVETQERKHINGFRQKK